MYKLPEQTPAQADKTRKSAFSQNSEFFTHYNTIKLL